MSGNLLDQAVQRLLEDIWKTINEFGPDDTVDPRVHLLLSRLTIVVDALHAKIRVLESRL